MNLGVTTRLIGATFGLCGFAVAIIAGLSAGNPADKVLATALVSMIICQIAGTIAGLIGERAIREHLDAYRTEHPIAGSAIDAGAQNSKNSPQDSHQT